MIYLCTSGTDTMGVTNHEFFLLAFFFIKKFGIHFTKIDPIPDNTKAKEPETW